MVRAALLRWQWDLYPDGHADRRNLIAHALTNPIFLAGSTALLTSTGTSWRAAVGGALAMVLAMAVQGRGHKLEATPPVPFAGPIDAVSRIFVEQWVTFPRFVLSGGFARALRRPTRSLP